MSLWSSSTAPERHPTLAANGLVSSSHPAISTVGAHVLESGGNAVDATLAMAAMSWLALPGQCGVAGDAFAVVREPDGSVWTVNGSGFGPDGGTTDFYFTRGLNAIPYDGALSVAAPGEIPALTAMHAQSATRSLTELWEPAIRVAEQGMPCTAKTRADILAHEEKLRHDADAAAALLPGGAVPVVGQLVAHPQLARTMRALALDPTSLYTGPLADRAIARLCEGGAPFSGAEWQASGIVAAVPAITRTYRGHDIHVTPQPTPGWMVLQQAAICNDWLNGLSWLDAESIHVLACAAQLSFADRFAHGGSDNDAWLAALDPVAAKAARDSIAFDRVEASGNIGQPDGDTTTTVAVDSEGRAVSFVHSLAFTFGSCISIPGTGVLLNNRLGRGAYLIPGHPNEVLPRRRPMHTLNAWIATDSDGELSHVGNVPGGDGQVQWNMQLISHLIDHDLDPQQAVDAPRFSVFPGSDADTLGQAEELRCESRIPRQTLDQLSNRGHTIKTVGDWEGGGSAQVISVDNRRGCLLGGADSRQDGVALGV